MSDETSIWKKEISLRRKPKPQAEPAPGHETTGETSIWKKEISLRRKPKPEPAPQAVEQPLLMPAEPATPRVEPPTDTVVLPPVTAPVVDPGPAHAPAPAAEPLTVAPAAHAAPPPDTPAPSTHVPVPVENEFEAAPTLTAVEPPAPQPVQAPVAPPPPAEPARKAQPARKLTKEERKAARHKRANVVGLKIGGSQVAAAHIANKRAPRLVRVARAPLPPGVVVGGEVRDADELAAALKALFRKNKLPQGCVRLGIANNRIGVRTFEITGVEDDKQLANAVRFRAQEALPIPLDEAVLDYRVLDDRVGENGVRVCRVLLVVAHRELVERYTTACRKAGLKLIGIDLEAFALLRAVADPASPPQDDAAVVCVAIGHDRSTLAVSDGRVCEFTRVLSWGGSDLDAALTQTLDVPPAAAEPLKRELGFGEGGTTTLDPQQEEAGRAAMVGELRAFARELVGSLRFYQEQPNSLGIAEIVITGGASGARGLADELTRLIGIPVRVADPLARLRVSRKLKDQNGSAGSLAVAVGLGIED
jgi:type IV pilus assembly protein PilM